MNTDNSLQFGHGHSVTPVFEKIAESDGGGYLAYTEELPGAISEGSTLEEARANLLDAVAMLLDTIYL
jgi:predicted RNase H-like HicB family nuclease